MIGQFVGAFVRSVLVMLLVVTPAIAMPPADPDEQMFYSVLALFAAFFIFSEYGARAPALIDFRFAAPINRHRFALAALCVYATLSPFSALNDGSSLSALLHSIGALLGSVLDFPSSPLRWLVAMLPAETPLETRYAFQAAAGASLFATVCVSAVLALRYGLFGWPQKHQVFNLWKNFPTFEATGGVGVAGRLILRARLNLLLAILMPFLIPLVARHGLSLAEMPSQISAATLIWIAALWTLLPANFAIRAIVLYRIALLVRGQRMRRQSNLATAPEPELSRAFS